MRWPEVIKDVAAAGPDLLNLSIGTPLLVEEVSAELASALACLATRPDIGTLLGSYANYGGLPTLIESFARRCTSEFGRPVAPSEIVVVPGAQAALRYIHEWTRQAHRRVLFPIGLEFPGSCDPLSTDAPAVGPYVSRERGPSSASVHFDVDSMDWENVGTVILSQPHSPTGRLWTREELVALADAAAQRRAWLVLDETYALPFAPITLARPPTIDASTVLHLYSLSKMGLAAERVGAIVGPTEMVAVLRGIMRQSIIQPSALGQHLAIAAINLLERRAGLAAEFGRIYQERWACLHSVLSTHLVRGTGVRVADWEGGAFLWCQWPTAPTSTAVFRALLQRRIAVAPSEALWVTERLGVDSAVQGLRIGLGASLADLERAASIIAQTLRLPL